MHYAFPICSQTHLLDLGLVLWNKDNLAASVCNAKKNLTLVLHWWSWNAPGLYTSTLSASHPAAGDISAEQKQIKLAHHKPSNFAAGKKKIKKYINPSLLLAHNESFQPLAKDPYKQSYSTQIASASPKTQHPARQSKEKAHYCDHQRESSKTNDERSPEPDRSHHGLPPEDQKKKNSLH